MMYRNLRKIKVDETTYLDEVEDNLKRDEKIQELTKTVNSLIDVVEHQRRKIEYLEAQASRTRRYGIL